MPDSQHPNLHLNEREQIQYLLGNAPSWMLRYGITAVAALFTFLLALSYFIRYPDIVEVKVVLTTAHPPIRVVANAGGRILELLVKDGQAVEENALLAVIANPARRQDVLRLEKWLDETGGYGAALPNNLVLGDLQAPYSAFSQNWKASRHFQQNNGAAMKVAALRRQIAQMETMNGSLIRQKAILSAEFDLAGKERQRQQQLFAEKIISEQEHEKMEVAFLQQKRQLENADAAFIQNEIQIRQLESQIADLQLNRSDTEANNDRTLNEDLRRLQSAIAAWKQQFLVIAPIAGTVSLSKIWSEQQSVGAGEEVLAIAPLQNTTALANEIIGKATLPVSEIGKLQNLSLESREGFRTIIRLDAYPAQEYGILDATIANLSAVPQEEAYQLDFRFPSGLTTNYGKTLAFRQEMTGQARIITEDRRVLDRILGRLRDLVKNQ